MITGVLLVLQGGINQTQERGLIITQGTWAVIGVQQVLLVVEQERLRVQIVQWVNIAVRMACRKQHHALLDIIRLVRPQQHVQTNATPVNILIKVLQRALRVRWDP